MFENFRQGDCVGCYLDLAANQVGFLNLNPKP